MKTIYANYSRNGWVGVISRNGQTLCTEPCPSWGAALAAACEKAKEGE